MRTPLTRENSLYNLSDRQMAAVNNNDLAYVLNEMNGMQRLFEFNQIAIEALLEEKQALENRVEALERNGQAKD